MQGLTRRRLPPTAWPPRLDRFGLGAGWRCVDVGAGGGDVSVALDEMVGRDGRIYAVDRDPLARDVRGRRRQQPTPGDRPDPGRPRSSHPAPEAGGSGLLPFPPCSTAAATLLVVVRRMADVVKPGSWVVAQEPITTAGRINGSPLSMPDARHQDVGALLPALVRSAGLEVVDAWAEAPAGVGPGPVAELSGGTPSAPTRATIRWCCPRWSR